MQMKNPSHPGAILRAYMGESVTVNALAAHIKVPRENLSRILNGRRAISPAVAMKLAQAFPQSDPEFWLGMQMSYDLAQARKLKPICIKPLLKLAA